MYRSPVIEFAGVVLSILAFAMPEPARAEALEAVIAQTLATSPDVRQVAANRRATDQQLQQSYAGYLPRVDFNGVYGFENSDNPTTRGLGEGDVSMTRRELGLTARQMVYDGNAVSSDVEFQRSRVRSAAHRVGETSESTALRTVEVYLEVLRRQEIVALAEESVTLHRTILEQIRARAKGGRQYRRRNPGGGPAGVGTIIPGGSQRQSLHRKKQLPTRGRRDTQRAG